MSFGVRDGTLAWSDASRSVSGRARAAKENQVPLRMEGKVTFVIGGREEKVDIDPEEGPLVHQIDGSFGFMRLQHLPKRVPNCIKLPKKSWQQMTSSEQETMARMAAKKNQSLRDLKGDAFWTAARRRRAAAEGDDEPDVEVDRGELEAMHRVTIEARCAAELSKQTVQWMPIGLDQVTNNHDKVAGGIIYGLDFPWSEDKLAEFGPKWLTQAFHAAGTLDMSNRVTRIFLEQKIKITAGNNAGKFLFEVKYLKKHPTLHTRLFAKVPFAMTPATKTDRLSSSVYKQPMDLCEIQTYRLMEASLPMKTPKFYYGDISNETSNFILITERIPFEEIHGRKKTQLAPYEVEGPYDKCMDWQLRERSGSSVKEYYLLLMDMAGRIAGQHKSGRMGSEEFLGETLTKPPGGPDNPMAFGFNPAGSSGENPSSYKRKLESAVKFISETAKVVFPSYTRDPEFLKRWQDTMLTWCAYSGEVEYYKCSTWEYVAVGHNNLNIDNAYFWRDAEGNLDCGIIDWGGFGQSCLGHKIYWCLNCSDFENIKENLDDFVDVFVEAYSRCGGPSLDRAVVLMHIHLTSISNCSQMMQAIPNCMKMCSAKEWETITDKHDPRIAGNIDGKSTLRSTLIQVANGIRMIEEMGSNKMLEKWIDDFWVEQCKCERKTKEMIFGV
mmetsp:Transcript_59363/g.133752  ORF Transcript_59363/g.133752 Transcript_59363/m.133752 type:complete len:667 (-) Transcript_59363:79-2079(-)